jgi:hypothetical protein
MRTGMAAFRPYNSGSLAAIVKQKNRLARSHPLKKSGFTRNFVLIILVSSFCQYGVDNAEKS